ncbi:hypothetical protein PAMP_018956 [Pampus punctatissimus]
MRQIYMTKHNIMCQYHVYAFTDQGASNSPPVCNSFRMDYLCVKKIRLKTWMQPHTLACSQQSEQLISFHFHFTFQMNIQTSVLYTQVSVRGLLLDILHRKETKERVRQRDCSCHRW